MEAHRMILYIPCQIQLQLCLSFSDPIPTDLGGIFSFFPEYVSLLPLPMHFHFVLQLDQKRRPLATLISCLTRLISYVDLILLIRWPIVDSTHKVSFVSFCGMMTMEPGKR